jgi:hypothetical protein
MAIEPGEVFDAGSPGQHLLESAVSFQARCEPNATQRKHHEHTLEASDALDRHPSADARARTP